MAQDEWQGSILPRELHDPLTFIISRVYDLPDRFLSGGLCSIRFQCQCGQECIIENITIEACDRFADYYEESERYFDFSYTCSCGINYKLETINSYSHATIRFCEGYNPPHIYYRMDFKAVEFTQRNK